MFTITAFGSMTAVQLVPVAVLVAAWVAMEVVVTTLAVKDILAARRRTAAREELAAAFPWSRRY